MKIAALGSSLRRYSRWFRAGGRDAATEPVPEMLKVPGGTFTMGADGVGEADEQPAHAVTIEPFWLDRTEVTNRGYLAVRAGRKVRPLSR